MTTLHAHATWAWRDERMLLDAARGGDSRAADELVRRYEPLVQAISGHMRLPCGCDRDDIA
jgi:DNA-directed RNA polymerase specialized sigma subunit